MTTTTMNHLYAAQVQASGLGKPSFAQIRANLPELPEQAGFAAGAGTVALRLALAAIPFATLGWLFFAR